MTEYDFRNLSNDCRHVLAWAGVLNLWAAPIFRSWVPVQIAAMFLGAAILFKMWTDHMDKQLEKEREA